MSLLTSNTYIFPLFIPTAANLPEIEMKVIRYRGMDVYVCEEKRRREVNEFDEEEFILLKGE